MGNSKRGKKLRRLAKPLYLNANLIYGECLNFLQKPGWKTKIKTQGTFTKLKTEGYQLVTSVLTRMEVMQRLRKERSLTPTRGRRLYQKVCDSHKIVELMELHEHVSLTPDLCDHIGTSTLDFKDALHLLFAKKLGIPVCTHDKKANAGWSLHPVKSRFYDKVFKPGQLIKKK